MVEIAILWSPGLVPLLANHASSVFQDLTKWPGNNGGVVKFTKRNEGGEWERVAQRRISLVERNVSRHARLLSRMCISQDGRIWRAEIPSSHNFLSPSFEIVRRPKS